MLKKIIHGIPQSIKDWWRNRANNSNWEKFSRGAAEITRMMPHAHGDQWRRTDKHQKNHDNHPHKNHRNK